MLRTDQVFLAMLIHRAGGRVLFTDEEIANFSHLQKIVRTDDIASGVTVLELRPTQGGE